MLQLEPNLFQLTTDAHPYVYVARSNGPLSTHMSGDGGCVNDYAKVDVKPAGAELPLLSGPPLVTHHLPQKFYTTKKTTVVSWGQTIVVSWGHT